MDRGSVWATCCHSIYWVLQDVVERISGGGVSISMGALRREPGEGGFPAGDP
jgi:hypothetical protein